MIYYIVLTISGFIAGFFMGSIGLGFGLVIINAMSSQGFHPQVSSATSGFLYIFLGNLICIINKG